MIYVGKDGDVKLPLSYCFFEGGMDEVGLENNALVRCCNIAGENIVLYNFSVDNAVRYSHPTCDCLPPTTYVVFKEAKKIDEFINKLGYRKMYAKVVGNFSSDIPL